MKLLERVTEDHMVAAFVQAEIDSPTFGDCYMQGLQFYGRERAIFDAPDLTDPSANAIRRGVLQGCRGYPTDYLFRGWPDDVEWWRAEVTRGELGECKFCNYPSWNVLTEGSRLIKDGAANVDRVQAPDNINPKIKALIPLVEEGQRFPELLVVATTTTAQAVVMEGHTRATAYVLAKKGAPDPVPVLAGFSLKLATWPFLGRP
jgi:hypothetical protein